MCKIVINIRDVVKPIVFTSKEDKNVLIDKIKLFYTSSMLELDNGDIFFCKQDDIKSVLITKVDQNDNNSGISSPTPSNASRT